MLKTKGSLLIETLLSIQVFLLIIYIISHLLTSYINEIKYIHNQYNNLLKKEEEFILSYDYYINTIKDSQ